MLFASSEPNRTQHNGQKKTCVLPIHAANLRRNPAPKTRDLCVRPQTSQLQRNSEFAERFVDDLSEGTGLSLGQLLPKNDGLPEVLE